MKNKQLIAKNTSVWLNGHVIDVRRLKALQAVVESGSVSAAAALLSYSPSAVSQQMSASSARPVSGSSSGWAGGATDSRRTAAL